MNNKTIKLHTIATFQGKEYELENLLNSLLNKLEEKDKEIEILNHECDTYMKIATKKQQLIDKAIEYIIEKTTDEDTGEKLGYSDYINDEELLNILQGSDKE